MPWSTTRPAGKSVGAKYQTAEHRHLRAHYARLVRAGELVLCSETECLFDTRAITETDGRLPHGLNLAHADDGITYKGASHRRCNIKDGAVRGSARSRATGTAKAALWRL